MRGALPAKCLQTLLSPSPTSPVQLLVGTFRRTAFSVRPQVFRGDLAEHSGPNRHASLSAHPRLLSSLTSCLAYFQLAEAIDLSILDSLLGARASSFLSLQLAPTSRPFGYAVHP